MTYPERANEFYQRGLDLWGEGHLVEAADCFREAISLTKGSHYRLLEYHGSLGSVLFALGQDDEALAEFVEALAVSIEQYGDDASAAVAVARHFLAEHLLKLHREEEALTCLAPSLLADASLEAALRTVEAECLARLGRTDEAIESAKRAVETAKSPEQLERIREQLKPILLLVEPNEQEFS